MMFVVIVYAVSWLILLCVYLGSLFNNNRSRSKVPWYIYALMIVSAPIIVLCLPYLTYEHVKERKEERRRKKEQERTEEEERCRKVASQKAYQEALRIGDKEDGSCFANIARALRKEVDDEKYGSLLKVLDKTLLPENHKFGIRVCKMGADAGLGDESKPYVQTPFGKRSESIFEFLQFEDSPMGAWQAFLLHQMWHYLPLWWHANYSRRDYIYSQEDVSCVRAHRESFDKSEILPQSFSRFDLIPEIRSLNGKYYISCCFWTEFGGLIREYAEVTLKDGKLDEFFIFDMKTLLMYESGIRY